MAEFDESKHKRDERGRFAKMETSVLKEKQTINLKAQEERRNTKAINSYKKQIERHQHKIDNPQDYVQDWDSKSEQYKNGLLNYWRKEIKNFENQIMKLGGK